MLWTFLDLLYSLLDLLTYVSAAALFVIAAGLGYFVFEHREAI